MKFVTGAAFSPLSEWLRIFETSSAAAQNSRQAKDEAAIREIVRQIEVSWNSKDTGREMLLYVEDVDYVNSYGTFIKGRDEIGRGHEHIWSTIYKDTTLTMTIEKIRFLSSDIAVVHVHNSLKKPDKTSRGWMTLIVAKTGKKWKITAQQITAIQEPLPR